MNKEATPPPPLNNVSDDKTIYLPYTPPVLTILEDSTIESHVGLGSDAGGYGTHHHS